MTGSGDQRRKTTVNASSAIAELPPSLVFYVNVELPPIIQPDFKAHRRKSGESSKEPSPVQSTSSQSPISSFGSSTHSIPPQRFRPPKDIGAAPRQKHIQQTKAIQNTRKQDLPSKSVSAGHLNQPRDWCRPHSGNFCEYAPSRTQIGNPNSASRALYNEKRSVAPSNQQTQSGRYAGKGASFYVPFVDLVKSPSKKKRVNSFGATTASNVVSGCSLTEGREEGVNVPNQTEEMTDSGEKSAGSRLLIKGGQIVNDDAVTVADVFVDDGIIKQVGPNLAVPGGARVIEARGKYVLPGGIDTNTNFQLPFMGTTAIDDFYSGTKAALAGGTTMIIGNAHPQKGEALLPAFEKWRSAADSKVCCDYGLSVAITHWTEKVAEEMGQLASDGINSFQFFMSYKDVYMLRDEELYRGFQQCKRIGALARVHAENGDLVAAKEREVLAAGVTGPEGHLQAHPEEVEIEATTRACAIARQANCPLYLTNVMSKGAADAIGDAKRKGSIVVGEAVVASLFADGGQYCDRNWRHAASFVMSPPLRIDPTTPKYLNHLLAGGDLNLSSSAHCAFSSSQKALGKDDFTKIPHGVNGVEERMMVVWEKGVNTGRMDIMRFVAVTSTNAAKIFNIYPKKGRITEGSDADIVIWDPNSTKTLSASSHHSQSDNNIFEGLVCRGVPYITIAAGKVLFEDGQLHVTQGAGKFVPLPPHAPHLFSSVSTREQALRPFKIDRDAGSVKSPVGSGSSMTVSSPSPPVQHRPEPYMEPLMPTTPKQDEFYARPLTKAGSRNMQDSTFAISGHQVDEDQGSKRSTRVSKPPGGESRGLW